MLTRLFDLSENWLLIVNDMWQLGWGVVGEAWRLFVWEEDLVCCFVLHNIGLLENVSDRWKWLLYPVKGYSANDVYHFFTTNEEPSDRFSGR